LNGIFVRVLHVVYFVDILISEDYIYDKTLWNIVTVSNIYAVGHIMSHYLVTKK